ncbi:MAG: glycosyltransferase family 39 protein [Gemmatimonadota bacterium]
MVARDRRLAGTIRAVWVLAGLVFLAHLAVAAWGPYELHRDALLYLAMGEHLHLLRMDFPPFIALVATAERVFGDSIVVIHVAPAMAHAALIVRAGAFARRARGGAAAQLLAAGAVATAPVFLRAGSLFQPVVFDQLWWTLALYIVLRIGQHRLRDPTGRSQGRRQFPPLPRSEGGRWALLGLVLGLGLLTKFTILVLGAALLFGLLASPLRSALLTPGPWAAAALAFVLGSPSISGQILLDWPFLGQFTDLQSAQLSRVTPLAFTLEQLLMVGPAVLIAVGGAVWTVTRKVDPGLRSVGWTTLIAFLLMLLAGGKAYYIAPIWPALLGIGMARVERWAGRLRERQPVAAFGVWGLVGAAVIGFGLVALPMGLPFLAPEPMARYAARLGVSQAVSTNTGERLALPQDYADMLGWEALADSVAATYDALPAGDRERAVILATNYGRAGAIDFYAGDRIPHAVAPVGSYWFWGPGDRPGAVTIVVGAEPEDLIGTYFREATVARRVLRPWGVPEEQDVAITVARDPIRPLQDVWPRWEGEN